MKRPIVELRRDIVVTYRDFGKTLRLHSTWGLFSPDQVDKGSDLLLQHLQLPEKPVVLDLGCGYGVLGLAVATRNPASIVHLVDKDFVAVEYTRKNIELNRLANAQVYLSNGFSRIPKDVKFNLIMSNLPAKVGSELYDVFFADARHSLQPQGSLWVVTIAGLKEFIKKSFTEVFGNYEKIKQSGTHIVARAVKTA